MHLLDAVVQYVAGTIIIFTLVYIFTLAWLGWRVSRRAGRRLGDHEAAVRDAEPPSTADTGLHVFYLVPCLNEALVIEDTVRSLLEDDAGRVIVIDDGSDDGTAAVCRAVGGGRLRIVSRTLPEARQGKGAALNVGLRALHDAVDAVGLDPETVIVCVMDADGRLTPGAARAALEQFRDPAVGGVQLAVRIRNRSSLVLRFQDMEFWAMSALSQLGRVPSGTVSMGGNGQFTRLTALAELGETPWSDALTEDLDLGISLAVRGWKTTSTVDGYVTQQGVPDLRSLLRQRTRWYQGHMQSIRRVPEIVRSPKLPNPAFVELFAYLLVPWVLTLPWSILQQYLLFKVLFGEGLAVGLPATHAVPGRIAYALTWYLISFSPHLFWGFLYWRRSEDEPLLRALVMAHLLVPWAYLSYFAGWRAVGRMILGRGGWKKTVRQSESKILPSTS